MRSLNKEQKEFVYYYNLPTKIKPVYRFLSGGAGCGKTHVINALYQTALKYYNSLPGKDFFTTHVLLMAPTRKTAYHIGGSTIHNAMKIPANQKLEFGGISIILIGDLSQLKPVHDSYSFQQPKNSYIPQYMFIFSYQFMV